LISLVRSAEGVEDSVSRGTENAGENMLIDLMRRRLADLGLPDVTAFGAGPRIFLWLPRESYAMIVARRYRVKRLPLFSATLLIGARVKSRRFAARASGLASGLALAVRPGAPKVRP
jgi:hypothetical protein